LLSQVSAPPGNHVGDSRHQFGEKLAQFRVEGLRLGPIQPNNPVPAITGLQRYCDIGRQIGRFLLLARRLVATRVSKNIF
jgi:hypothetical protein